MLEPRNLANGGEQYEDFTTGRGKNRKKRVQYDYRHQDGELFSTVKPTLAECREARDNWLAAKATAKLRLQS